MNRMMTLDVSALKTRHVVSIGSWPVNIKQTRWVVRSSKSPVATQIFHSASWVREYYRTNPREAVELLVQQARMSPNPGNVSGLERNQRGWSESQVTKRMHAVLCVYQLSKDPRLKKVLSELAQANMDPRRYYGPPNRAPHNHGVLANEVLRRAGQLLGQQSWIRVANSRDQLMVKEMFEDCGMAGEQSSSYQVVNIKLWERLLEGNAQSRAILERAKRALGALMRPDGDIEYIGDGFAGRHSLSDLAGYARPGGSIMCPRYGWAAAHTEGAALGQHVLRFGPDWAFHGHYDHGALTWWVGGPSGVAVLSDRGNYTKDFTSRNTWAHSEEAHSTLTAENGRLQGRSTAARFRDAQGTHYRVNSSTDQGSWTRDVHFASNKHELRVEDRAPWGRNLGAVTQRWHLAPGWSLQGDGSIVNGAYELNATCRVNGKIAKLKIAEVEHYSGQNLSVNALELRCQGVAGDRFVTTLSVNRSPRAQHTAASTAP